MDNNTSNTEKTENKKSIEFHNIPDTGMAKLYSYLGNPNHFGLRNKKYTVYLEAEIADGVIDIMPVNLVTTSPKDTIKLIGMYQECTDKSNDDEATAKVIGKIDDFLEFANKKFGVSEKVIDMLTIESLMALVMFMITISSRTPSKNN